MFIQALNRNLNLQRFKVLYVTGNSSAILSRLDRRFEVLVQNADRVFYFEEGPREIPRLTAKTHPRARENQRTLEAYS